jgi:hypothetical protein
MSLLIAVAAGAAALAQQDAPAQRPAAPQLVQLGRVALAAGQHERLCFTPDGSHLALAGLRSTRVVDATGAECARCDGTMLVQPGPAPGELWLLTEHNMRRWNAATRTFVGEPVTWPGRHLRLTRDPVSTPHSRPRSVIVRDGQPWTDEAARMPDGSFRELAWSRTPQNDMERKLGPLHAETATWLGGAAGAGAILLTTKQGKGDVGTVYRFDAAGAVTHEHRFTAAPLAAALGVDGATLAVALDNATVHVVACESLQPVHAPALVRARAIVALANGEWLVATDDNLVRLHPRSLAEIGRVASPEGLGRVDVLVRNADGTRLALADDDEVRILRVE